MLILSNVAVARPIVVMPMATMRMQQWIFASIVRQAQVERMVRWEGKVEALTLLWAPLSLKATRMAVKRQELQGYSSLSIGKLMILQLKSQVNLIAWKITYLTSWTAICQSMPANILKGVMQIQLFRRSKTQFSDSASLALLDLHKQEWFANLKRKQKTAT